MTTPAITVTEFISRSAAAMTEQELRPLCSARLQPIARKMLQSAGKDADQLLHIIQFLIRVASEFDDYQGHVGTSVVRKEAAFGLKYFLEENDAIPDHIPHLGLKDDLIIARTILKTHEAKLTPFADACGYRWDKLVRE
ncbi:MAG: YkvA family protein [Verrucomicrobiota bacterium]